MAYRIVYDQTTNKYEVTRNHTFRFPLILVVSYILFYLITAALWPEGKALIQEVIIPGDNAVTMDAFRTMTDELRAGSAFKDAVYTFCCEIIDGAKTSY